MIAGAFAGLALAAALTAGRAYFHANRVRVEAQLGDSLFRAVQARDQLDDGLPVTAMQLALAGLPEDPGDVSARAWAGEPAGRAGGGDGHSAWALVPARPRGGGAGRGVLAGWRVRS